MDKSKLFLNKEQEEMLVTLGLLYFDPAKKTYIMAHKFTSTEEEGVYELEAGTMLVPYDNLYEIPFHFKGTIFKFKD
ncbi:MAG: hypothetical protein WC055_15940 [Melioribacteraceae bacterium]